MQNPDKHRRDVDMSEAAINRRMRTLSELYQFWRSVERSRAERGASGEAWADAIDDTGQGGIS
jgi:hypothetical protein